MRRSITLCIALLLPWSLLAQPAAQRLKQAVAHYESFRIETAHDLLTELVRDSTLPRQQLAEAHKYLGATYALLGNRTQAITAFQRALELDPRMHLDSALLSWEDRSRRDADRDSHRSGIRIASGTPGTALYVDDRIDGLISAPRLIRLSPGTHRLGIRARGCTPWDTTIVVTDAIIPIGRRILRCP